MKKFISAIMVLVILFTLTVSAFASEYVYYPTYTGNSHSIVDGLNAVGEDSSFANRKIIAERNGIKNYRGSAEDNQYLLDLLKQGRLIKSITQDNKQTYSAPFGEKNVYYPAYTGTSTSLVDCLRAVGVNSSFSFREKIAAANGISDYRGTATENTALLQKLRRGELIDPNADVAVFNGSVGGIKDGVTVIKDHAPLRAKADGSDKILYRAEKGAVLELLGIRRTGFLGAKKWYKVSYNGSEYYIFGENAEIHTHEYTSYTVSNMRFKVCNCGHVAFTTYQRVELQKMESYATLATTSAMAALADGPLPVGDIVAAVMMAAGTIFMLTEDVISTETAQTIATDIDYIEDLKTVRNECNDLTYRMVARMPQNLKIIGDSCLNVGQAYVYVRYCGGDVWCTNSITATTVAQLHGNGYYTESDKNQLAYYSHIHLGKDATHKVGGHIFYGTNALGQTPDR